MSHYRNQTDGGRTQVNDFLTESLAFTEELIYLDYLNDLGYKFETKIIRDQMINTFYYTMLDSYPLIKAHIIFNNLGEISEENYKMLFKDNDYKKVISILKDILNEQTRENFENDFINNKEIMDKLNDTFISDIMYILAAPLSIYMYEEYKKDNRFIEKIKELNDSINNKTVLECLNIIELSGYNEESLNKISESFKSYINDLTKYKTKIIQSNCKSH